MLDYISRLCLIARIRRIYISNRKFDILLQLFAWKTVEVCSSILDRSLSSSAHQKTVNWRRTKRCWVEERNPDRLTSGESDICFAPLVSLLAALWVVQYIEKALLLSFSYLCYLSEKAKTYSSVSPTRDSHGHWRGYCSLSGILKKSSDFTVFSLDRTTHRLERSPRRDRANSMWSCGKRRK